MGHMPPPPPRRLCPADESSIDPRPDDGTHGTHKHTHTHTLTFNLWSEKRFHNFKFWYIIILKLWSNKYWKKMG